MLPVLEQMGVQVVDERPYEIRPEGGPSAWIYDFGLAARRSGVTADADEIGDEFLATFGAVWRGEIENDGYNRLVLTAGLAAREIRSCGRMRSTCARSG